jgi:hypothetical protein
MLMELTNNFQDPSDLHKYEHVDVVTLGGQLLKHIHKDGILLIM